MLQSSFFPLLFDLAVICSSSLPFSNFPFLLSVRLPFFSDLPIISPQCFNPFFRFSSFCTCGFYPYYSFCFFSLNFSSSFSLIFFLSFYLVYFCALIFFPLFTVSFPVIYLFSDSFFLSLLFPAPFFFYCSLFSPPFISLSLSIPFSMCLSSCPLFLSFCSFSSDSVSLSLPHETFMAPSYRDFSHYCQFTTTDCHFVHTRFPLNPASCSGIG